MAPIIYYLNKSWDAAGFGHAAILLPTSAGGYTYYSYFASRRFVPLCKGTLLIKEFPNVAEAFAYARDEEGYTREMHWRVDPVLLDAAHAAIAKTFITGSRWSLLSRNCWHAVHAALLATGVKTVRFGLWPNRIFRKNIPGAEGWSHL